MTVERWDEVLAERDRLRHMVAALQEEISTVLEEAEKLRAQLANYKGKMED